MTTEYEPRDGAELRGFAVQDFSILDFPCCCCLPAQHVLAKEGNLDNFEKAERVHG